MLMPPEQFLATLYDRLPFLVVHLTTDGIVLHCNPETTCITGYEPAELVGRNFWAALFPGRLFAQVPKFISAVNLPATPLLRDTPMTIRTRRGDERVLGMTRFVHASNGSDPTDTGSKTLVCVGVDLTDRLLDADKSMESPLIPPAPNGSGTGTFTADVGNEGTVDGDVVTPIAISPPAPHGNTDASREAVRQVHEFLTQIDERMAALQSALFAGEMRSLETLADSLQTGAHACGLLEFHARAEQLRQAAAMEQAAPARALAMEILELYRPSKD